LLSEEICCLARSLSICGDFSVVFLKIVKISKMWTRLAISDFDCLRLESILEISLLEIASFGAYYFGSSFS
jgi:hypothetical protein